MALACRRCGAWFETGWHHGWPAGRRLAYGLVTGRAGANLIVCTSLGAGRPHPGQTCTALGLLEALQHAAAVLPAEQSASGGDAKPPCPRPRPLLLGVPRALRRVGRTRRPTTDRYCIIGPGGPPLGNGASGHAQASERDCGERGGGMAWHVRCAPRWLIRLTSWRPCPPSV